MKQAEFAYDCANEDCWIAHASEEGARLCGFEPWSICECGHMRRYHCISNGWPGCYDLDCRCPEFKEED